MKLSELRARPHITYARAEIVKAMYEGTVLNPEQAVEFGLVHEIKAKLSESGAKIITIS